MRPISCIKSPVLPLVFLRRVESQEAEEGVSVTLLCELSKPGVPVEWKKASQVLTCGEKYQMKQTGLTYELQICDLRPEDTGSYSCTAEDTTSSASVTVNGRTEIRLIHPVIYRPLHFHSKPCDEIKKKKNLLFHHVHQLAQSLSRKSWKAKELTRARESLCTVSCLKLAFPWSGGKENLAFARVPSMR